MNMYLYLPPSSSHPYSILKGFIYGLVLRIYRLTSTSTAVQEDLNKLFRRLLARGYKNDFLIPIFIKAHNKFHPNHKPQLQPQLNDTLSTNNRVFLHLQYHPNDPPSSTIQHLFHRHLYQPISIEDTLPLPRIRKFSNVENGIDRLVVAYSRPPNLGNRLSSRLIKDIDGPSVSTFIK